VGGSGEQRELVIVMDEEQTRRRQVIENARATIERLDNEVTEIKPRAEPDDWRMRPRFEPQPPPRERKLDTVPESEPDWSSWETWLQVRLQNERDFSLTVVPKRSADCCTRKTSSGRKSCPRYATNCSARQLR
jgi:hypothetical protein